MEETPANRPPALHESFIAACLFVIATVMLAVALAYTRTIMIPFVVALFLSYFVSPVMSFLEKKGRFPHWLAVGCALLVFCLGIAFIGLVLRGSIIKITDSFYLYQERLYHLTDILSDYLDKWDIQIDRNSIAERVKELPIFSFVQSAAGMAFSFLVDFLLVFTFLIFILAGRKGEVEETGIAAEIDEKIRGYIMTKVFTAVLTGLAVGITLAAFKLDLALLFGLLAFFLNFIPTLGAVIATLLPLPIALIQYEDPVKLALVLGLPMLWQLLIGNLLEPKLLEKGLDLHPVTILLALMFWGLIWGLGGMFLAVPITAVLKIALGRMPLTRTLAEMLAGRSPFRRARSR